MQRAGAVAVALLVVWTTPVVSTAFVGGDDPAYDPASVDLSASPSAIAADALREAATRDVTVQRWRPCDVETASRPTDDGHCQLYSAELDREDGQRMVHPAGADYEIYRATCTWVGDLENDTWARREGSCGSSSGASGLVLSPGAADLGSLSGVTVLGDWGGTMTLHVADTAAVYRLWTGGNTSGGPGEGVRVVEANATLYVDSDTGHLIQLDLARVETDGESRTVVRTHLEYSKWDTTEVRRPDGAGYSVWEALAEARPGSAE